MSVHEAISRDKKLSLVEIDDLRKNNGAYNYLCHLEECKQWIESMIKKEYRDINDFENQIPNGIDLCLLALTYAPDCIRKIYYGKEKDKTHGENDYKYTDNIHFFINSLRFIKLPDVFIFDTVSLYERKNIPSVIFCLHALSHYLTYKGFCSKGIKPVYGVDFSQALLDEKDKELKERERMGIRIPEFDSIKKVIHKDIIEIFQTMVKVSRGIKSTKEQAEREKMLKKKLEDELNENLCEKEKTILCARKEIIKCRALCLIRDGLIRNAQVALKARLRTFIYEKSFKELFTKQNISIFTFKFYLFVFFENYKEVEKEREIERIVEECNIIKNDNYDIESYVDELIARVGLLLNNKLKICNISVIKPRLEDVIASNYQFELDNYNFIFNILQTEPEWFLDILESVEKPNDFVLKFMTAFFCRGRREEKYLVDFIHLAFNTFRENDESILDDKIFISVKTLMNAFFRGTSSKFKEDIFVIIGNLETYDIENDPSVIFNNIYDKIVTREEALKNETVAKVFLARAKTLRVIIKTIVDTIQKNISEIPFAVRLYLKKINELFAGPGLLSEHVVSFFYKEFIYPFVIGPDVFEDIKVTTDLRNKLKIVVKCFQSFVEGESYLSLNVLSKYFNDENVRFRNIVKDLIAVNDINNEFSYYISEQRPFLVFSCRHANELIQIAKENIKDEDVIYYAEVFEKIKNVEVLPDSEKMLTFYLNKFIVTEQKNTTLEMMIKSAKMRIVELLRIANGRNLHDLLVRKSTEREEVAYQCIINSIKRNDYRIRNLPYNNFYTEHCEYPEIPLNYFFRDESDYETTYSKNGVFFKTLDEFKEDLFDSMLKLEERGIVRKDNFYNDMLYSLADDILRIRFSFEERRKNLEIHKRNLNHLREKKFNLEDEMSSIEAYLSSFAESVIRKRNKNAKGREDKYGSFSEKASKLLKQNILIKMNPGSAGEGLKYNHGNLNDCIGDISIVFACNEPGVFMVIVLISGEPILEPFSFRFDELLKMRFKGVETFSVPGVCEMQVEGLVSYLNKKYVLGE